MSIRTRNYLATCAACLGLCAAFPVHAAANGEASAGATTNGPITNSDDIVVTATKVNQSTPITASLQTFEPQSIISRSIIENSVPPTADYSQVIMLTPGASLVPSSGNGVGLGDAKITLRGFTDGHYNMTYDGIPFGDSNDPTHHSTSYFPNGTYERIIVDRGPGGATDLGQASYGGNVHIISREATDKFFVEEQGVYGSFNSMLERLTVNSGSIQQLGDLKLIAVGEYKQTDGALSNQPGWWANGYIKLEKPLGNNALFTVLANYNQSMFNQSDAAGGATLQQIQLFGKNFGATTPGTAAASRYPNARNDWNWENKTTDFEIARLQVDASSHIHIDNKLYTYFYKNFTLSSEDSTTQCDLLSTADQCVASPPGVAILVKAQGTGPGGGGGKVLVGDIAGYTKLNQYRQWGDVLQVNADTSIGILKAGLWYEHSSSKRYRYDYDFTTASRAGGISDYNFAFNIMNNGSNWNWKEKDKPFNTMLNGQFVPAYIKYDERTSWDQIQGFGEFDFKLLNDTLTITPGVKVQDFTRKINTPIAAQSSRIGIHSQQSYKPTLPYATINYLVRPDLSVYAQFAKGFLIPSLGASLESKSSNPSVPQDPLPTKTTNYQAGLVYSGNRLNVDADVYYIEASNSTFIDPTNSNNVVQNALAARYKGVEGQVSYVVLPGLTAIANGTVMSSKNVNDATDPLGGKWLQGAPNYTALLGAVYSSGRFKLSYLHKFTGHQWIDAKNSELLGAYNYGVLSGSMTFGRMTVGVSVTNVFNDRSVVAQSQPTLITGTQMPDPTTLYMFQAPRSVQAQLKIRL